MKELTDLEIKVIEEANSVKNDLKQKSCRLAFNWCQSNKSKLAKTKSSFEFKLFFQEFIELLRAGKRGEAMEYIKKNSENYKKDHFDEIKKAMGCLLVKEKIEDFPSYKHYFEEQRWDDLVTMFRKENYSVFSLTSSSMFAITLQVGFLILSFYKKSEIKKKLLEGKIILILFPIIIFRLGFQV